MPDSAQHVPYRQRRPDPTNGSVIRPPYPHFHQPARSLTVQRLGFAARLTPRIRLVGQWLDDAGFRPGDKVTVTVRYNQLVITPTPAEVEA